MAKALFAWELGANYGHLARQVPTAQQLWQQGHQVFFAVKDTTVAAQWLSPQRMAFAQAPINTSTKPPRLPPANYAEILIASGYSDKTVLWGMVQGWLSLVKLYKADIIIIDHAPTALFAAYLLGIPALAIGTGFEIPPDTSPLPSIRPWETIEDKRLANAEGFVLAQMNRIAAAFNKPKLDRLADLFRGSLLATFAELDHYGTRPGAHYAGPLFADSTGQAITWQDANKPHLFAYLRPGIPGFKPLLAALAKQEAETILVAPGIQPADLKQYNTPHFRILAQPVQLDKLLPGTTLAITAGGTGTVSQCLLAGIPVLLVPQNVEQHLMGLRVEALGAGLAAKGSRQEEDFTGLLQQLLQQPRYKAAAQAFAGKYAGFKPQHVIGQALSAIHQRLASRQ